MNTVGAGNGQRLLNQVAWRVVPAAAFVLLAIGFAVALVGDWAIQREADAKLKVRAQDQAQTAIARFEQLVTTITDLANNELVVNGLVDPTAEQRYLRAFFRSVAIESFSDILILLTDYRGRPISGKNVANLSEASLRNWNDDVSQDRPVLAIDDHALVVAVPVYISDLVEGMLVVRFTPEQFKQFSKPLADNGSIDIVPSDGHTGDQASISAELAKPASKAQIRLDLSFSDQLQLVSTVYPDVSDNQPDYFKWAMLAAFLLDLLALNVGIFAAVFLVIKPLDRFIHQLDRAHHQEQPELFETEQGPLEVRRLAGAFNRFVIAERQLLQERSHQAEKLEKALDREKELNGLQRQLVSLVSHEFRTPLAIIDGNAHRVARKVDQIVPEHLTRSMQTIRSSITRLTNLMESVLSVSKLDEGRIKFAPAPCDVGQMIVEVCAEYQQISAQHSLVVDVDRFPHEAMVDATLIRQVLSNLISNAIKYSPGGATVRVEGRSADNDDEMVIAVTDQGLGIPENELGRLFERFFRASTSTGISGTGIGLHLVKHVTDLHNGRVEVASRLNEGTTFTLYLPVHQTAAVECEAIEQVAAA